MRVASKKETRCILEVTNSCLSSASFRNQKTQNEVGVVSPSVGVGVVLHLHGEVSQVAAAEEGCRAREALVVLGEDSGEVQVDAGEDFHAEGDEVDEANDRSERVSPPLLHSKYCHGEYIHTSLVIHTKYRYWHKCPEGLNTYPLCTTPVMIPVPPLPRRQVQPRKHDPQPAHSRAGTQH